MAKKSLNKTGWLQANAVRACRAHFLYVGIYMLAIIIFDSWNLYTHEAVGWRWTAVGILLVINTVLWYAARIKFSNDVAYVSMVLTLIVVDIVFAALNVYWERGLASNAVALFAVPIVTAGTLRSRITLLAAAALSSAAYSIAAVRYYFDHYGEAFRVELWGTLFLYCGLFFLLAWLLFIVARPEDRF